MSRIVSAFVYAAALLFGVVCFFGVARAAGIYDARAGQVSCFYAVEMLVLWLLASDGLVALAVLLSALLGSVYMLFLSCSVIITPPQAWLFLNLCLTTALLCAWLRK